MMTIFLCGFMGCGKTTVGKILAKKLGLSFYDLDSYIVQKENRSIPEIFEADGESYFRKAEAESIGEIAEKGGVIATGGGAMLNAKTAEFSRSCGTVVYLDVSFSTCYRRIRGDENRPLVVKNTKEQLRELYNKRRVIYAENSTYKIQANCTVKQIISKITEILPKDLTQKNQ